MKEEGGGRGRNGNERQTNAKQMLGAVLFPSQDACAAPGDTGSAGLDSWSPGGATGQSRERRPLLLIPHRRGSHRYPGTVVPHQPRALVSGPRQPPWGKTNERQGRQFGARLTGCPGGGPGDLVPLRSPSSGSGDRQPRALGTPLTQQPRSGAQPLLRDDRATPAYPAKFRCGSRYRVPAL